MSWEKFSVALATSFESAQLKCNELNEELERTGLPEWCARHGVPMEWAMR